LTSRQDNPTLERLYAIDSGSSEVQLVQELPLVLEGTPQTNEDDGTDQIAKKLTSKKRVQTKKTTSTGTTKTIFSLVN
jgi:hypothetical protein